MGFLVPVLTRAESYEFQETPDYDALIYHLSAEENMDQIFKSID